MEKMIALLSALVLVFLLAACGSDSEPTTESPTETTAAAIESDSEEESTEEFTESAETETAEPSESTEPEEEQLYQVPRIYAQTYRDSGGKVWVMGIAEVQNTSDAPLDLGSGEMTLTAEGETVAVFDFVNAYPRVILPGESGYYYEVAEMDVLDTMNLELSIEPYIVEGEAACEYYRVFDERLADSPYGGLTFSGKVENTSDTDGEMVCIAVVLLDENGRALGIMSTYLSSALAVGAEAEFSMDSFMLPEELTVADVAGTLIYAYPVTLY